MVGEELPVERLRQYLSELSPEAKTMLVGELERGILRSEEVPGTDLVLRELRRTMRQDGSTPARVGNPMRLFFQPFEPFLVDDGAEHHDRYRIARATLEPIWNWISRDVMPEEAKAYSDNVTAALQNGQPSQAETLARSFQDRAARRLAEVLATLQRDAKAMARLSVQLASKRASADVENVITILRYRDTFATLGGQMPPQIKTLVDPQLNKIKLLLESPLVVRPDLLPFALTMVMQRLDARWELIRLAIRAARSETTMRIAANPFGIAVGMVLDEIERMVHELRAELRSGQGVAVVALLKNIHDAVHGVCSEIDLSTDSPWHRQLSGIRAEIATMVKAEVDSMPGRVRRMLRARPAAEIAPGQTLDQDDIAEVAMLIGFVDACRHFADALAINEMTPRALGEVRQYIESVRQPLLDGLRSAGERERAYRKSQLDAAVRFSAKLFGRDYAAALAKAAGAERQAVGA